MSSNSPILTIDSSNPAPAPFTPPSPASLYPTPSLDNIPALLDNLVKAPLQDEEIDSNPDRGVFQDIWVAVTGWLAKFGEPVPEQDVKDDEDAEVKLSGDGSSLTPRGDSGVVEGEKVYAADD